MSKGLFIIGTDTGVGKTFVAGALAALLRARGIDVGVMKPAETGCIRRDGQLHPQDALYLRDRAESTDPLDEICPYPLEMPSAPSVAADAAGIAIDLDWIADRFHRLARRHQLTLVEGAGGLLVPLTDTADYTQLIQKLQIPALLVARASLGTINHTLLTSRWARHVKLPLLGVVVNSPIGPSTPSEEANLQALAKRLITPLLGYIPHLPDPTSDLSLVEKSLRMDRLLELLELG
ncbi:MAG: dethiobiotin synthase [Candidatus Methylomirabilales bacterium]